MLNQILSLVLMSFVGTAQGLALEQMLETNDQKTKRWFRVLYWTLLTIIPSAINVILLNAQHKTIPLQSFIGWVFIIVTIFWFYRDPMWRRILAIIFMFIGMTSAELVVLVVVQFTNINVQILYDKTNSTTLFLVGVADFISIVVIAFIVVVWKKVFRKGSTMKYLSFFLVYVFNYVVTLVLVEIELNNYTIGINELLPMFTSIFCEIVLLAIVFSQAEKENLENKLFEERKKAELEQLHYGEVKHRREKIAKISNENREEVLRIKELMKNKDSLQAENELKELLHKIEMTKENQYCGIPIINAILSEKQKECEQSQIHLQADICIPEEMQIEQMDLCRVLGNLLDSAIRASKKVAEIAANERPVIQLMVVTKGEYFIIKCENPTAQEPGEKPEGSGYGLKILKDIAKKYEGDFRTKYQDKRYEAQMSVRWGK